MSGVWSHGKGDVPRKRQISDEEWELRLTFRSGDSQEEFNKKVEEIRQRTGKP
jgi:hypothetical protein